MKKYQTQQEEIATIRPRCVYLNLSQADVERVTGLAGQTGMTVGELLTNFVGDLVEGTYSNGSDERAYARNWFSRCDFSYLQNTSMLSWLLSTFGPGEVDSFITSWDEKKFYEKHPEEYADETAAQQDGEKFWFIENVDRYTEDFVKETGIEPDMEKEAAVCRKWLDENLRMNEAAEVKDGMIFSTGICI